MKNLITGAVVGLGLLAAGALVAAPNFANDPLYGTVELAGGFMPDPHTVQVTAGGPDNVREMGIGATCVGYISASQPDVRLNFQAGSLPLTIKAASNADTTIVINAPDGSWHCNDDFEGLNPGVRFQPALSGQYDIWVGTYSQGTAPAQVLITEL